MLKNYLLLLRPNQWIKNVFVLAPLIFAIKFFDTHLCLEVLKVFCLFCLASSLVYIFNDIYDVQTDKKHPLKKSRPIAAGLIGTNQAIKIGIILFFCLLLLLYFISNKAICIITLTYIGLNILYTIHLKKIVIVDVLMIAVGFILRIYAGAFAINVPVSGHIILCTTGLSMFLGFSKRKLEIMTVGKENRSVLKKYSQEILDKYIMISAILAVISYFLYTLESYQIYSNLLMFSSAFVIYGIFRYIMLIEKNNSDDLVENLLNDKPLVTNCCLYVLYIIVVLTYIYVQ